MTTTSDKALAACTKAFEAWNATGEACAEMAAAYTKEGTKETHRALSVARAQAQQALGQARQRFYAAVDAEFMAGAPR